MRNMLNPHFYGLVATGSRGRALNERPAGKCGNFRNYAAQFKRFRQKNASLPAFDPAASCHARDLRFR
jgi:hypothetical protein